MANELFAQADINKDGKLQLSELRMMLNNASKQYSHFAEHARFLDGCVRSSILSFCVTLLACVAFLIPI